MTRSELKSIINECIEEILYESSNDDDKIADNIIKDVSNIAKTLSSDDKWKSMIKSEYRSNGYNSRSGYFKKGISEIWTKGNGSIELSIFVGTQEDAWACEKTLNKYANELSKLLKAKNKYVKTVEALTGDDHSDIIYITYKSSL